MITGGTGTLGYAIVKELNLYADNYIDLNINKIIVLSRNEANQVKMRQKYPEGGISGLRYFIGDIRDYNRLVNALRDVDYVIHAAALKSVDISEYNPNECVATNVIGTQNVIRACIKTRVKKAIFISTDKAVHPSTLYGATKLLAERLFINANNQPCTEFACVRYGNILNSNSSVMQKWKILSKNNKRLPVTDMEMTRFFWKINEAAEFILRRLTKMEKGVIYVPKMKSQRIMDIALKYSTQIEQIGIRGHEKIHEILITEEEARHVYDRYGFYTIYPFQHDWCIEMEKKGKKISLDTSFNSKDYL